MQIVITGLDSMQGFAEKLKNSDFKKVINGSIKKSIFTLERASKINTPVDTGTLRNSYKKTYSDLEGRLTNFRLYGFFVHEGHKQTPGRYVPKIGKRLVRSFIPGNPWMQRTIDENGKAINDIFENDIDAFIKNL